MLNKPGSKAATTVLSPRTETKLLSENLINWSQKCTYIWQGSTFTPIILLSKWNRHSFYTKGTSILIWQENYWKWPEF